MPKYRVTNRLPIIEYSMENARISITSPTTILFFFETRGKASAMLKLNIANINRLKVEQVYVLFLQFSHVVLFNAKLFGQ